MDNGAGRLVPVEPLKKVHSIFYMRNENVIGNIIGYWF
jgi:hypothetical protein